MDIILSKAEASILLELFEQYAAEGKIPVSDFSKVAFIYFGVKSQLDRVNNNPQPENEGL